MLINPKHYKILNKLNDPESMSEERLALEVDRKLREVCVVALNKLASAKLINMDETTGLSATSPGR